MCTKEERADSIRPKMTQEWVKGPWIIISPFGGLYHLLIFTI
jgi:hypothetical protein